MTIEEYFKDWLRVISTVELSKVLHVINIEYKNKLVCPSYGDIFKAFELCSYSNLKIVMIGQDPYPQKGVATGILFGNKKEVKEENLSPSLNIIKESVINFEVPHNYITFDQTLESWAKQGILMINSALTVEMNKVGSHTMLWRPFIAELLKSLSAHNTGIIYVLFGNQAKTFKPYINSNLNYIIEEIHPAYFARIDKRMPSTTFIEIDRLIKDLYGEHIEWYIEN